MVPHIVRQVTDADGNVVEEKPSSKVRQVITRETSEELRAALELVVSEGTGKLAYVPGYRLAGKTGTANKVVNGVLVQGKYMAWFIGFAPANDPKLAFLVMIDEPKGAYYGGQIAAPVFSGVMRDVLRYLEVPPQAESADPSESERVVVPDLTGKDLVAAQSELREISLAGREEGPGDKVRRQFPVAGDPIYRG